MIKRAKIDTAKLVKQSTSRGAYTSGMHNLQKMTMGTALIMMIHAIRIIISQ